LSAEAIGSQTAENFYKFFGLALETVKPA